MTIIRFYGEDYDLKNMHTKQLKSLLDDVRASMSYRVHYDGYEWNDIDDVYNLIKRELSKRENIFNKKEAKEYRQEKARVAQ